MPLQQVVHHLELSPHANTMYGNFNQFCRKPSVLSSFKKYGILYSHTRSMDIWWKILLIELFIKITIKFCNLILIILWSFVLKYQRMIHFVYKLNIYMLTTSRRPMNNHKKRTTLIYFYFLTSIRFLSPNQ